ncbi:MAG: deaminase [Porticoccus sp.]
MVYGATEPRAGAVESQLRLTDMTHYNHKVEVVGGVLAEECSQLISNFFRKKR